MAAEVGGWVSPAVAGFPLNGLDTGTDMADTRAMDETCGIEAKVQPGEQFFAPSKGNRRVAIEFNPKSYADITWVCDTDGMNKSTVANRAVQVYRLIRERQMRGEHIQFVTDAGAYEQVDFA